MEVDDDSLLSDLKKAIEKQRKWNGFFAWHDRSPEGKTLAECGIVDDLLRSLEAVGRPHYCRARPSGANWPDCEADLTAGGIVGIEVTELVDAEILSKGKVPTPWSREKLVEAIQERIRAKDFGAFHGGRYDEVLLLIHTDEFYLTPPETIRALDGVSFQLPHGNLDSAYLLFSYWPELGYCPATQLDLDRSNPSE